MDVELNQEQLAFAQVAREFAYAELAPNAARWDQECIFPTESFRRAGELGFCGIYAPQKMGGLGLSRLDATVIFEELAAVDPSTAAFLTIHNMAAWMVGTWGSATLIAQVGADLASGRKLASYCLTEPGAGSDAKSLRTTAQYQDGYYRLNGAKAFISGAGETQILIVMARTGHAGAGGISAFAVKADLPGISYGRKELKMGWNSQSTRAITFDDVEIPAHCLLSREGQGFKLALKGLVGGRINIAACSVGAAQGAMSVARDYMRGRKQFNKELTQFQALQFKYADMATQVVAARQMVRLAACKLDSDSPDATIYSAMAKRFATDAGFAVCLDAQQLLGGYGYLKDYPLERLVRDTRVHQILEGTNEIMRVIIAQQLLEKGLNLE